MASPVQTGSHSGETQATRVSELASTGYSHYKHFEVSKQHKRDSGARRDLHINQQIGVKKRGLGTTFRKPDVHLMAFGNHWDDRYQSEIIELEEL